jgi:hypothetical protein
MRRKLFISWDELISTGWEYMKYSLEQGYEPDLITELTGWLDAIIWEYGSDYDIVIEGVDFKEWKINSYEDVISFIEAYESELSYNNELFFEEIIKDKRNK